MEVHRNVNRRRNSWILIVFSVTAILVWGGVVFGPYIVALIEIENDKHEYNARLEKARQDELAGAVAQLQARPSLEDVDAKSRLLAELVKQVITDTSSGISFPADPSGEFIECAGFPFSATYGSRFERRYQGTEKAPDDSWMAVRDRVISVAGENGISLTETDKSRPGTRNIQLSESADGIQIQIFNMRLVRDQTIISVNTGCNLPAAHFGKPIRPGS